MSSEYESYAETGTEEMQTVRSDEENKEQMVASDAQSNISTNQVTKKPTETDTNAEQQHFVFTEEPGAKKRHTIFSLKSKSSQAKDRFAQKAQDYMESYKMSIYLQDAIKLILDRREEKPLDLLNQYFNTALKGEHILLREYAFVSATQLNRKSFLQQVNKVFHSSPHFKVITALDYHQMICLVCSDFPRNLMIETVQALPLAGVKSISAKKGHDLLFEQYDLDKLQGSVCIHFYYTEFMENVRTLFQEASTKSTLDIEEKCSLHLIYTQISNLVQRMKNSAAQPMPPIEAILEVLIAKADPEAAESLVTEPLVVVADLVPYLTGQQISYLEFTQGMVTSRALLSEIFEPVYNARQQRNIETLKEIASEQATSFTINAHQNKKLKTKKAKKL